MFLKLLVLLAACLGVHAIVPPVYNSPFSYGAWNAYNSYPAQPAITTQQSNILRSPFNLGQLSTYSKTIDTPFSSVRKSDVRISNPGVAIGAIGHGYAGITSAPYLPRIGLAAAAAPVVAPVARVTTPGLLGVAYSAAPAVSHMTYNNGFGLSYGW